MAADTKIGVRLLEAIEAEQFEKLPGGVFRKSFVLQYAHALGVDAEEIAGELKQLDRFDDVPMITAEMLKGRERTPDSGFALRGDMSGFRSSTIGSLIAAVGVIMACALIYSWWQTPRQTTSAKVETAGAQPRTRTAAPPVTTQASPAAPSSTPPTATPADAAGVRVDLNAAEKTWISIATDGKNVFSSALEPHQTKVVEASEKVRLLIGNAGGVEISLNGKPIGPVGPRGQVRVVELTPAGFQIVPRKPPTVEPL